MHLEVVCFQKGNSFYSSKLHERNVCKISFCCKWCQLLQSKLQKEVYLLMIYLLILSYEFSGRGGPSNEDSSLNHAIQLNRKHGEQSKLCSQLSSFKDDFLIFLNFFQNYFRDGWNVFDFIIVLGSLLDYTFSKTMVRISVGYLIKRKINCYRGQYQKISTQNLQYKTELTRFYTEAVG